MQGGQTRPEQKLMLFIDATVQRHGVALGVVLKNEAGQLVGWRGKPLPPMTINEAEYEALICALELAWGRGVRRVCVFSDSRVVVEQMAEIIRVHHDSLKRLHARAQTSAARFVEVSYTHIPRELNVLADAMAEEAMLRGRLQRLLAGAQARPHRPEEINTCSSS